jgi:hypothetical protein
MSGQAADTQEGTGLPRDACLQCEQTKAQVQANETICGIEGGYEYIELEAEWPMHHWRDWSDAELAMIKPEYRHLYRRAPISGLQHAACEHRARGHNPRVRPHRRALHRLRPRHHQGSDGSMNTQEPQSTPEIPAIPGAAVEPAMRAYMAKKMELRSEGDGPLERGSHEAIAVLAALAEAAPFIKHAAWLEGHEAGFWNGRASAGSGEMAHVGVEHAKVSNPYPAAPTPEEAPNAVRAGAAQ